MTRDDTLARLRRHGAAVRRLGVRSLSLFGSTARRDARPASDVDLFHEYEKGTLGLLEGVATEAAATAILGCRADAMPRAGINRYVRPRAGAEASRVF